MNSLHSYHRKGEHKSKENGSLSKVLALQVGEPEFDAPRTHVKTQA